MLPSGLCNHRLEQHISSLWGLVLIPFCLLASRWDEGLLSPDLTGTGRWRLSGALLALAVVPSACGMGVGVICIRAEVK